MHSNNIVLLLEDNETIRDNYLIFLNIMFNKVIYTSSYEEALKIHIHYNPKIVIIGNGSIENKYDKFLERISFKKTDIYICCNDTEQSFLKNILPSKSKYRNLPSEFKHLIINDFNFKNIEYSNNINGKEIKDLNAFYNPALICSKDMKLVTVNTEFNKYFDIDDKDIKELLLKKEFINQTFFRNIVDSESLLNEYTFSICDKKIQGKVYVLENNMNYLIVFSVISNYVTCPVDLNTYLKKMLLCLDEISYGNNTIINLKDKFYYYYRSFKKSELTNTYLFQWLKDNKSFVQECENEIIHKISY